MNDIAKLVLSAAKQIRDTVAQWEGFSGPVDEIESTPIRMSILRDDSASWYKIYQALLKLSEPLANSYAQVKTDIKDTSRLSWSGTAHEIREVLSTMLRALAPDEQVLAQPWYQQDSHTSGPTQKQRVRYILQLRGAGSKEAEVAEQIIHLDEMIGDLARGMYSRASDAAHRYKPREEVQHILRYFDTFAQDLLDLG